MLIEIKHMSKCFGPTTVLNNINMKLLSGTVYGFQGINGSGKTMLMRAISGLIHPTEGEILIDGHSLTGENSFPPSMGLLIENPSFLNNHTGYANLKMLSELKDNPISDDEIYEVLKLMGLSDSAEKKVKKYSLGMRQRLGIACAIMEKPELLILDEPFNSLDEHGIECTSQVIKDAKKRGALIIIACHDHELLSSVADEIFKIVAGNITRHMAKDINGVFYDE